MDDFNAINIDAYKPPAEVLAASALRRDANAARAANRGRQGSYQLRNVVFETHEAPPAPYIQPASQHHDAAYSLRGYVFADILGLITGFLCAWLLAFAVNASVFGRSAGLIDTTIPHAFQLTVLGAGLLLWFEVNHHYDLRMPFWTECRKIVEAAACATLIDGFLQFATKQDFSRLWLVAGWAFSAAAMIGLRSLWRKNMHRQGAWETPVILIGAGPTAEEARRAVEAEPNLGLKIVAQVRHLPMAFEAAGCSWKALCFAYGARYVLIALDGRELAYADEALSQLAAEGIGFSVASPLHCLPVHGVVPHYLFNHDVMLLTSSHGLDRPLPRLCKRIFDIVLSVTALVFLSPVLAVLALAIKLDGGPAFYKHKRLGQQGRVFSCLKFRSMAPNGDKVLKRYFAEHPAALAEWLHDRKLRDDPRVTRIGNFMRRTSLDELPQLLNVLKGEMSIVGPRPIVADETPKYNIDIAYYYRVRPGLTGLWQVSGRNNVSYAQRVRMDRWYVRNWSPWHDLAIICKTLPAVLKQSGAY